MAKWSIAEAKAGLSRLVAGTKEEEQIIQNRGVDVAVVLGVDSYRALVAKAERSSPGERKQAFLEISRAIGARGGAEIELPPRKHRPSPFAGR